MSWTRRREEEHRKERRARLLAEVARVVAVLKTMADVLKVYHLGSSASGKTGMCSDIDLLVVRVGDGSSSDRATELYQVLAPRVALDLLVYSPEELRAQQDRPFLSHALANAEVIYEKQPDS